MKPAKHRDFRVDANFRMRHTDSVIQFRRIIEIYMHGSFHEISKKS